MGAPWSQTTDRHGSRSRKPRRGIEAVQAVERAAQILDALAHNDAGVSEISKVTGLHKATAYRLLCTLRNLGFVELRPDSNRYRLGIRILELAGRVLARLNLRDVARPYLAKLRDQTKLTVHMGILDGVDIVYVDKLDSPSNLRMASFVGARNPAHTTGLGKAILAALPSEELDELLSKIRFVKKTKNAITSPDVLRRELASTRARGYSIDNVENEDGIRCVGAPVFNHTGSVVAAISVSGPIFSITLDNVDKLGELVAETAKQISKALGHAEVDS